MENLVNAQKELKKAIDRGLANYKKSPRDRITIEYIEIRLENVERDWILFHQNHSKLFQISTAQELESSTYTTEAIYENTEEAYVSYKCILKADLNKLIGKAQKTKASSSKGDEEKESKNCFVNLPKISLPTFSGNYSEWPTFRDLFTSLVHNNESLSNVQKLHYLKGQLSGEAEQLIRHTPITNDNYSLCWDLLEKRYNNKRYLSNCILTKLFNQKHLNSESSLGLKQLLDTTCDCLSGLENIGIKVFTWDVIIIHIVTLKLDTESRKQWELHISNISANTLPTWNQLKEFLESRFRALEFVVTKRPPQPSSNNNSSQIKPRVLLSTNSNELRCEFCSDVHKLCFCKEFAKQECAKRRDYVLKNRICFNCLGSNHSAYECKSPNTCKVCKKRHHSLLHMTAEKSSEKNSSEEISPVVTCLSTLEKPKQVLLATALVNSVSKTGEFQLVRALLDQGSQACFVTEATVQLLRLKRSSINSVITGLGGNKSVNSKYVVNLTIQSRVDPQVQIPIKAFVLKNITSYLPEKQIQKINWVDLQYLPLADPEFTASNRIDLLLGAEVYSYILREGVKRSPAGSLIAQNTILGWIISGAVDTDETKEHSNEYKIPKRSITVMHAQVNEDDILKKFWEIEEQLPDINSKFTEEEQRCEEFFKRTTTRTPEGRYTVRLPFREEQPQCINHGSRDIAEVRFRSLEKRFAKDSSLKEKYTEVINEYLALDHMRPANETIQENEATYLPHHAVVRNDKTTTKVRVVFNASEKNKKAVSLNDTLMIGPTIQADLRHTVLRWRGHPIALVADIVKMYRQVLVAEDDVKYQRILWRDSPEKPLRDFELRTVTFGTASAPYLAVRVLQQIAMDEGQNSPKVAERILTSFYMDDLMTGCSNIEEGIDLYKEMSSILEKGGFKLQKWNSNDKTLMNSIMEMESEGEKSTNEEKQDKTENTDEQDNHSIRDLMEADREQKTNKSELKLKLDQTVKILGLTWNRDDDLLQYTVVLPSTAAPVTKRQIISDIARLFDPLGWIAPTIILAKIFIQRLWLAGVGWDEQLSNELIEDWNTYRSTLQDLTIINIPRWIGTCPDDVVVELHGFCDASKAAYSAVVYLRTVNIQGQVQVSLLNAKTRVAPIKQVSIPRLELCGAVLLSRLLSETATVLGIPKDNIRAWTDSTIVLAWLNTHPSKWKTFVANRTSEILTNMNSSQWNHVSTKENPADLASRGVLPAPLADSTLWFRGPPMIHDLTIIYQKPNNFSQTTLEESASKVHIATLPEDSFFERFSSLARLLRIVAYCRRFIKKTKSTFLRKTEIDEALQCCIRQAQVESFSSEYAQLLVGPLDLKSSSLRFLCPKLDENKIIRVTGRLQKSQGDDNFKHPIVLPKNHHLTKLIVADAHEKTFHGGPQLMMNYLRSAYWILSGRNIVRQYVHRCVICAKQKAETRAPFMGSLPTVRCTPARPFLNSGVDYAGPINIRTSKGRGHRSYKGYIALFVCMSTRAIHLELVSDMTTQAFLAAFKRFTARRGHCSDIWSDNGTTFVGASKELQNVTSIQQSVAEILEVNGTTWHFIPPHAPNFGGLWEAGVKSTKFHLKRVIGDQTLTFEELSTFLTQVEACLNSRPISVIHSDDPSEPLPLTPGHFLIGEPLLTVPEPNYETCSLSSLSRWQSIQRSLQSFWKRWSQEYLGSMLNRYKWRSHIPEPEIGQIVLIKEDDLPPSRWLLGRIIKKHPGDDNVTRVVTLRTKASTIKRPVSKICILPIAH